MTFEEELKKPHPTWHDGLFLQYGAELHYITVRGEPMAVITQGDVVEDYCSASGEHGCEPIGEVEEMVRNFKEKLFKKLTGMRWL